MKLRSQHYIRCFVWGMILLAAGAFTARVHALNIDWNNPQGGDFSDEGNWAQGVVPGASDVSRFYLGGEYTVNLTADTEVNAVILAGTQGANIVTLDMGGYTLTANSENVSSAGIAITSLGEENLKVLRFTNGKVVVSTIRIGQGSSNLATLEIGSGATLDILAGSNNVRFGNGATGLVRVVDGGKLNGDARIEIGRQSSNGILWVEGTGSLVKMNPEGTRREIRVGAADENSHGELAVLDGGRVEGVSALMIARNPSSGSVLVSGTNSSIEAQNAYVGGTNSAKGGEAAINVSNDGAITLSSTLKVYGDGQVTIGSGSITAASSTWEEGAAYNLVLGNVSDNPLSVSGNITFASGVELNLSLGDDFVGEVGEIYKVLSYGSLTGTFAGLEEDAIITVDNWSFQISYGAGSASQITLTVTSVIPESKATMVVIIGVLLCALGGYRRCRS